MGVPTMYLASGIVRGPFNVVAPFLYPTFDRGRGMGVPTMYLASGIVRGCCLLKLNKNVCAISLSNI